MNLLITGGAGFIGANFILYWLKHHPGDRIVNLDKLTYAGNLQNLSSVAEANNYIFIKGDICDSQVVNRAIENIDCIVHFAAETHVDRSITDPQKFIITNVLGTQTLLEAARSKNVRRFHHISTDEVFGSLDLNSTNKFHEATPYAPNSPYAASKAASDHIVRAYYHTYGLPVTISNCSNNYGPYQYPEKLIALTITNVLEGKKVPVYGDGMYIRDWLYVEDHCRAIDLILDKGEIGRTYCIGGLKVEITNIDIVKKILSLMGAAESEVVFVKDRIGHDRKYIMDWSYIHRRLGWAPQFDLDTYLKKTIQWYTQNRSWWMDVKSGDYKKYYRSQYEEKV
ncbi:dTDP-glucose 4,6-dehydratase [Candidatus Gottesmanbacteria bacterium RBG_16_43_7]|uniref:dTDP-glucose 4,6-dehydratase n=1 Tax=Candidatus Gottesmanbacteria bacterium RBG_16_43_7 TaxID=1798373 RepID=A0A1F5Z7B2_9BACT|nr:MAG: dTDP-glucose 4,6-dehydratase [Candidatus Gottesmanbacteria bacterium RBG_16_43_7]